MEYEYSEPERPSSHRRVQQAATCHACGARIGARERRLTWRIRDGADVYAYHYCSDACLPATAPETP
ncbi:DUF7576 family protein [Halosolutus halophilus]|uniref:DUF7576 family protein n=1 Tax=Halosolutus halophilus TaxID=1552990 RepID=UPI0022352D4F|nr:hypothetical protein [Halosolutus halophilus]